MAKALEIENLIGKEGRNLLENRKNEIKQNPTNGGGIIQSIINDFNKLKNKLNQYETLLRPLREIKLIENELKKDEGLIEIFFDGNTAINDFKEARDQMDEWF